MVYAADASTMAEKAEEIVSANRLEGVITRVFSFPLANSTPQTERHPRRNRGHSPLGRRDASGRDRHGMGGLGASVQEHARFRAR